MPKQLDILYHISHGFSARMLTQTHLLKKLVENGLTIGVICPDKNDPNLKQYCETNSIELIEFNVNGKLSNQNYMFKRMYFLEEIRKNPALWEKYIYATKYNRSKNPLYHIWPRYYRLIYELNKIFPSIREKFVLNEKKYLKNELAEKIINEYKPKKYISTYPVTINEAIMLHAANKSNSTETWIHLLSWDNISCKGHFPELATKYISWGPIMEKELMEYYGVSRDFIFNCGVPHFDLHKNVKEHYIELHDEVHKLDAKKPILFFAMSSPRFAPKEIDIVEQLATQLDSEVWCDYQMIVRPHPQNMTSQMGNLSWIDRLKKISKHPKIFVDFPIIAKSKLNWSLEEKDMQKLTYYISISNVILNSGSTFSIDAMMQNKPVILTSFDADFKLSYWKSARRLKDYNHLKNMLSFEGIPVANGFSELVYHVDSFIKNPSYLKDKRELTINNFVAKNHSSTDEVVLVLSK